MRTSTELGKRKGRAYAPVTALAQAVELDMRIMHVEPTNGRIVGVPIEWFPTLAEANPQGRAHRAIRTGGLGLRWRELYEDIFVAGLTASADLSSA